LKRTSQVLSFVYLVNKQVPSNHCQVLAQYYANAITPRA